MSFFSRTFRKFRRETSQQEPNVTTTTHFRKVVRYYDSDGKLVKEVETHSEGKEPLTDAQKNKSFQHMDNVAKKMDEIFKEMDQMFQGW